MPQAALQGKPQTMDEALAESIAAHEDGEQEPIETQAAPDAPEAEEQPPEQPDEAGKQEDPEAEEQPEVATPPKEAKSVKPTPVTPKGAKDGKQPPPAKGTTAPSSWPPHLREQFHTLPRPVKDHILKQQGDYVRREAEYSRNIQAAKQQQEAVKPLTEALSPYIPHLQAVGIAPAVAVRNLFQTEYVLRTGGEPQKAAIVANLMSTYGVTPAALVSALQGKPVPEQQEQPRQRAPEQPPKDPRLDVLLTNLQRQKQAQEAARDRQDEAALQDFLASGQAEFFDDVAEEMADLAKLPRYKNLPFAQLYEKACLQNDNVRTVLEKRKADEAVRLRSQKAQKARQAASSVRTEPGAPQGARKASLDDELRRVIEAGYGPQAV